jgi:hypothetical protein
LILGLERLLAHLQLRRDQVPGMEVPAVINISLALTGGPKDGSSLLDGFIEEPRGRTRRSATCCRSATTGSAVSTPISIARAGGRSRRPGVSRPTISRRDLRPPKAGPASRSLESG